MTEDIYFRLREFMDQLPAGYPATKSGVEIKILQKLFSPEEAELVMKLKREPEEVAAIASRTGISESELALKLEELAQKGLLFRVHKDEKQLYQPYQFLLGLYEFQLNKLDREFCELYEEYFPQIARKIGSYKTAQMRIVPVQSSLQSNASIAPYNQIREMVAAENIISLTQCICKKERGIMGHNCTKPQEVCLMFGDFARYFIDNNMARPITVEEAMNVLDLAEKNALVLNASNTSRHLEAICCCCTCCCPFIRSLKLASNPAKNIQSNYRSAIDRDLCTGCEECLGICPLGAIKMEEGSAQLMANRCIGCGLCTTVCPVDAISMQERQDKGEPPAAYTDVLNLISSERGIL